MTQTYDVAVIGGGPAGATCAALLAERGRSVLVLEREKFPRYQAGESLTAGVLPVLDALGLRERVHQLGLTKQGGTLRWGSEPAAWDFQFAEADSYRHCYQVRRADLDALLVARARELGAQVIEDARVEKVPVERGRVTGLTYRMRGETETETVQARVVVDASGQAKVLGRLLDLVEWHEDLRDVAVWSYFQGNTLPAGPRAGDTLIENRPDGWLWFIPMPDATACVGYVTRTNLGRGSEQRLQERFAAEVADSAELGPLLQDARRVAGFRSARNGSYQLRRMWGPGWCTVGDAAAFVDPLFSSGLATAMRASQGLAETLDWAFRNPELTAPAMDRYQQEYRGLVGNLREFVRVLHEQQLDQAGYQAAASALLGPADRPAGPADFAILMSGLAGLNEIFLPPKDDPSMQAAQLQRHEFA